MARPSIYTDEIINEICARLSEGEPLAQICRDEGMPAYRTVKDWIDSKDDVSAAIARARDCGEDVIASECLKIADDGKNDWMERLSEEEQSLGWKLNGEHVQRSKLRIETRLKLLAKWNPKKYGDSTQIKHADADGNKLDDINAIDARLAVLLGKAGANKAVGGEGEAEI